MAEEAILKVSLKDYKQQIDELRASLLSLDSASKEYQETAEQVKSMQDKLNEVMSVGKKSVDGVEGSYNALRQQLSELKKEWQTLEIGSERWNELGAQIDGINDKLKEADASIGIFNRNVGDYAGSFEEAGKSLIENIGQINPILGQNMNAIKKLIPMIKTTTKTATAGLKGIKAALVGTGIGALIVSLGVLLNLVTKNWDAIKDWVTGVGKAKKAHEELEKQIDATHRANEAYINFLKSTGASEFAIQAKQLDDLKGKHRTLEQEYNEYIATHRKNSKHAKELWSGVTEAMSAVTEQQSAMTLSLEIFKEKERQASENEYMTELQRTLAQINQEFDDAEENAVDLAKAAGASVQDIIALRAEWEEMRNKAVERAKRQAGKSDWQKETEEIKKRTEEIADSYKTEIEKLTEKYQKELKLFKKHKQDTTALTKKYNEDMERYERELAITTRTALESSYNALLDPKPMEYFGKVIEIAESGLEDFAKVTGQKMPPKGLAETVEFVEKLNLSTEKLRELGVNSAEEYAVKWYTAMQTVTRAQKQFDDNILGTTFLTSGLTSATKELTRSLNAMDENSAEYAETEIEITRERVRVLQSYLDTLMETNFERKEDYKEAKEYAEDLLAIEERRLKQQERALRNGQLQAMLDKADLEAQKKNASTSPILNNSSFAEGWKARIAAAKAAITIINQMEFDSELEREQAQFEANQRYLAEQRAFVNECVSIYSDLSNGISSIFGSIADIYELDIDNQVKHGNLTQKEAEKEYKRVQGIKIASAVIDTLQGALAAFMGYQELPQPAGAILGAIQAAAVTAAGVAQIAQISSQNPYSSSVPSSSFASATPKLADYSPDYFSNLTNKSDVDYLANSLSNTNIYVSVTDINEAQNKVKVRDNNSTF